MNRSGARIAIVILLAGLALGREARRGTFDGADAPYVEWVVANSRASGVAPRPKSAPAIVAIDDESLAAGDGWPWLPIEYALTLRALHPHAPAVVCVVPVLAWDTPAPDYIDTLVGYCLRTPKLLLGWQLAPPGRAGAPLEPSGGISAVTGDIASLPEASAVERAPQGDLAYAGFRGFLPDPDTERGSVRCVPLLFRHGETVFPSFPLQAILLWLKLTPDQVTVELGSHIALGDARRVPIDGRGCLAFDPLMPASHHVFKRDELLADAERRASGLPGVLPLEDLRGQVAIVGRTDASSRTLRFGSGGAAAPVELIARTVSAIQRDTYLRRVPLLFDVAVTLAIALFAFLLFRLRKRWSAVAATGIALAVYALATLACHEMWHACPPLFSAISLLTIACLARLLWRQHPAPALATAEGAPPRRAAASYTPRTLRTADGLTLRGFAWTPVDAPARASAVLIHGLGDCIERQRHVSDALARHGIAGVQFDQRGHGRSEGPRGHVDDYQRLLDDVALQVAEAAAIARPVYLVGFSLGGQIAINFLLHGDGRDRIHGAVAVAPWLELAFRPPAWRVALARLASRVAPAFRQRNPVRPADRSADAGFLRSIEARHLTHRLISMRLFCEAEKWARRAREAGPDVRRPLLLLHGMADPTTSHAATERFHRSLPTGIGELRLLPGARHEPHCESDRDSLLDSVAEWIVRHSTASVTPQ